MPLYPLSQDYTLGEAHKLGFTIADFRRFLLMHPLSPGMKEVIQTFGAAGVPQFVCSDGNTVFINLVLEANGLLQYFPADHIFANPAHIEEDGRIRVKFFQNQTTHQNCPVNMCKGCVIQRIWQHDVLRRPFEPIPLPTEPVPTPYINDRGEIMNELPHLAGKTPEEINEYYRSFFPRHTSHAGFTPSPGELRPYSYPGTTVYFGDGSNDLCAAKQLRPTDFMAGRDGHQLVRKYSSLFQKGEDVRASQPPFPTDYQAFLSRLTKSKSEGIVRAKLLKWGHYEDTEGVALREVCRHVLQEVGLRVPERR